MNVLVFAVIAILIPFFLTSNLVYSEVAGLAAFIGAAIIFFWKDWKDWITQYRQQQKEQQRDQKSK